MKRRVAALITGSALIFAIVLTAAPRLHDFIHKTAGPNHECAVTIFTTGKCDAPAMPSISWAPPVTISSALFAFHFSDIIAVVPCSILEHAPPAVI